MENLDLTIMPPEYRELTDEVLSKLWNEVRKTYHLYVQSDIMHDKVIENILKAENERPK